MGAHGGNTAGCFPPESQMAADLIATNTLAGSGPSQASLAGAAANALTDHCRLGNNHRSKRQ